LKKRNYIFLFFLPLLVYFLSTCKKYPEDKFISLGSAKVRLDGEWKLEKFEIDGVDVISKYNDSLGSINITDCRFWFRFDRKIDKNSSKTYNLFVINKSSKKVSEVMEQVDISGVKFNFQDKKKKTIGIGNVFDKIPIADSILNKILIKNLMSTFSWEIRMLHNKNLIIEKVKNNLKYRLCFRKTRNH
jgi:hypothetical protein